MDALQRYLEDHSKGTGPVLEWLERETRYRTVHPRMLGNEPMGSFLTLLVQMIRPRNVLEIGTFTGYSAICLSQGLAPGGSMDALEINDELEPIILEGFKRAGIQGKVRLIIGDALVSLDSLAGNTYDLVYIDANKREYTRYYEKVVPIVRSGGYIIADNVLWDGKVFREEIPSDPQGAEIVRFNTIVKEDHRTENFILPLRDGLNIIRKL
jgi:predicted O-methyltransferase YrrM